MTKTIYLNLEDDVAKVVAKLKREKSESAVLVFPKQSFIFSDSINLRLLKKQIDMLGKKVSILTMDERGQNYAKEAGFELKHMPKTFRSKAMSDIRPRTSPAPKTVAVVAATTASVAAVRKLKKVARKPVAPAAVAAPATVPVHSTDNVFLPPDSKFTAAPRRRSMKAYVVGFIAVALVVVLLLVLVVLPSADIKVYAKSQSVARDLDILADTSAQTTDSTKLIIPAVAVNETQTVQGEYQTNGKKEVGSKAEGRVSLYNLTGSPLNLKASTTTLTVGSKVYYFKSDVNNIHALTSSSNDANATVADIIASEGGEGFNLPAGTRMEITNEAFGSQPQRLYAKTVTQVVGGTSRFISVISKDDITAAQTDLTKKVVDDINAKLAAQNVKLVDGAYTVSVTSFTTDKPEGTEAQSFTAQLTVTISGLAFNETDLKNMIRQRLLTTLGPGKTLQEVEKDTAIYKIKNLDLENGLMQLAVHYETMIKPTIDPQDIENKIAGKSKQEASDVILSNTDVDKVEITLQPAWQSGLPNFTSKIYIEVKE